MSKQRKQVLVSLCGRVMLVPVVGVKTPSPLIRKKLTHL
jgi:hypothetical protein